ncbi:glutaredoxin [Cellulomonas fimi]|uniref:Glutaredoxin n=1 Tax=Cellulomonas fimi TaxID=1708 RepID=A0A7Y0QHU7_CELFI|nr:glutaredoxin [Cellulomonas fimi]NMR21571.1 glutaredoxin [Cellulomonas fimi]
MSTVPVPPPLVVTVVRAPACHFCADAEQVLGELGRDYPLTVRTLEVASPEGRNLVAEHRAAMAPLVLLDGQYFSSGRLPRKKLLKELQARAGSPALQVGQR